MRSISRSDSQFRRFVDTTPVAHLINQIGAKSLDLAWQVAAFKNSTIQWESYDAELNALNVVHTRK